MHYTVDYKEASILLPWKESVWGEGDSIGINHDIKMINA